MYGVYTLFLVKYMEFCESSIIIIWVISNGIYNNFYEVQYLFSHKAKLSISKSTPGPGCSKHC